MPLEINQSQQNSLATNRTTTATQTTSVASISAFLAGLGNTQGRPEIAQLLPLIQQLLGQLNQQPATAQTPTAAGGHDHAAPAPAPAVTQPAPVVPTQLAITTATHATGGHDHAAPAPAPAVAQPAPVVQAQPAVATTTDAHGHDHGHEVTTQTGTAGAATTVKPGHDFYSHVSVMYPKAVAAGETQFGGYAWTNASTIVGQNPITGLQPVIDQAISDVLRVPANKKLAMHDLESKVAQRLTQLNDWTSLNKTTQAKLVELTGTDFGKMTKAEREKSINHLLHSPQPFGDIKTPLTPNMRIDLNYTHTLDKTKTTVTDLGNGLFDINLLSNNNNGSHTGHSLGAFKLQLAAGTTVAQAKSMANAMVSNTNNNNELYLSASARQQLATVVGQPVGPTLGQVGATYSSTGEFQSTMLQNFNAGTTTTAGHAGHAGHANIAVGADGKMLPGHDFVSHVQTLYPKALAAGQSQYGGYAWVNNNTVAVRSPITGLQPVIDQAINDVMRVRANKQLPISEIESKVAKRLTELNDWTALNKTTQAKLVELTGVDFSKMKRAEQEKSINHLLHSPLPFGDIQQALRPDMRVDMAYTHTLDKSKTMVNDLGNGLFKISMISNNNNGSHTGHNLGSFNLQLAPGMSVEQAKEIANKMVINSNNNNELYLSDAARNVLQAYIG